MSKISKAWQWLRQQISSTKQPEVSLTTPIPFVLGEEVGHEWGGVVIKIINREPLAAKVISSDPYWMRSGATKGFEFKETLIFVYRGPHWVLDPKHKLPDFVLGIRPDGKHFFEHFSGNVAPIEVRSL